MAEAKIWNGKDKQEVSDK